MNHIKQLIRELEMNQTQFAERFGLSKSGLSDIVNGKIKNLPTRVQLKLVEEYKINPSYLMTGNGEIFVKNVISVSEPIEKITNFNMSKELDEFENFMEHCRKIYVEIPTPELRTQYIELIKKLEKNFFKWDEIAKYLDSL